MEALNLNNSLEKFGSDEQRKGNSGEGLSYVESTFHLVSLEADEKGGIDTVESLCLMGRDLE